jgi:hypothetical protein
LPKWGGIPPDHIDFSLLGDRDVVFPLKKQKPTAIISGGTHLMLVSHNQLILDLIRARLDP